MRGYKSQTQHIFAFIKSHFEAATSLPHLRLIAVYLEISSCVIDGNHPTYH